jgi:hypothetical protein
VNGQPGTAIGSATPVSGALVGSNAVFTFASPPSVTAGTLYFVAINPDVTSGQTAGNSVISNTYFRNSDTYASFPSVNPAVSFPTNPRIFTVNITPTTIGNWQFVHEGQQDGAATYVQDLTVGHSDLYGLASTAPLTPASVVAVTTRGLMQRSDAGSRGCPVALKSGSTTVLSSPQYLPATGFAWTYRSDTVDPNTGSAWLSSGVDAVQIGPTITY